MPESLSPPLAQMARLAHIQLKLLTDSNNTLIYFLRFFPVELVFVVSQRVFPAAQGDGPCMLPKRKPLLLLKTPFTTHFFN
jgi:hypothetical protein